MDDRGVGALFRAVRINKRLRQADVAGLAGVSQGLVSKAERGLYEHIGLAAARRIAASLDIRLRLDAWWRSGDGERLLDRDHAALVELAAAVLRAAGWVTLLEYPVAGAWGRGSVDLLAWHARRRVLCVVEVKTRLLDLQELLMAFSRKLRALPAILRREQGWDAVDIGRLLVVAGTRSNRAVVARHPSIFDSTFPGRTLEARAWIRD
jgi:transcriptional regulator with XRE-family HTH domain